MHPSLMSPALHLNCVSRDLLRGETTPHRDSPETASDLQLAPLQLYLITCVYAAIRHRRLNRIPQSQSFTTRRTSGKLYTAYTNPLHTLCLRPSIPLSSLPLPRVIFKMFAWQSRSFSWKLCKLTTGPPTTTSKSVSITDTCLCLNTSETVLKSVK